MARPRCGKDEERLPWCIHRQQQLLHNRTHLAAKAKFDVCFVPFARAVTAWTMATCMTSLRVQTVVKAPRGFSHTLNDILFAAFISYRICLEEGIKKIQGILVELQIDGV